MTKPIALDVAQSAFFETLAAGRYASTDEAVLEGLRLLQDRKTRPSELREAWREGIESGGYEPPDPVLDDREARCAALDDTAR